MVRCLCAWTISQVFPIEGQEGQHAQEGEGVWQALKEGGEGARRTARLGAASNVVPPGPLKQKLDQVTGHNAVIQFVLKVATVLALLYPGAPDTSPALYAAILAVLLGKTSGVESGGFRDLPKGRVSPARASVLSLAARSGQE